jgi:hypothetical protein
MSAVHPFDQAGQTSPSARGTRRTSWFSRPKSVGPAPDQEAEVRERLYARPAPTERTVERIDRVERIADRPAA